MKILIERDEYVLSKVLSNVLSYVLSFGEIHISHMSTKLMMKTSMKSVVFSDSVPLLFSVHFLNRSISWKGNLKKDTADICELAAL